MNLRRRAFLKGILASGGSVALGTAVLPQVMADSHETDSEVSTVISNSAQVNQTTEMAIDAPEITIDTPNIAENGQVVPVEVMVDLPKVESIAIIAEDNPVPLVATFHFADNAQGYVKTRIRMAKTSDIVAKVKADGKEYMARRKVKVTVGGCGG